MVLAHFFLHQNANGSAGFSKQIESCVYIKTTQNHERCHRNTTKIELNRKKIKSQKQ